MLKEMDEKIDANRKKKEKLMLENLNKRKAVLKKRKAESTLEETEYDINFDPMNNKS